MNRSEDKTELAKRRPQVGPEKNRKRLFLLFVGILIGCVLALIWYFYPARTRGVVEQPEASLPRDVGAVERVETGDQSKVVGDDPSPSRFILNATPDRFRTVQREQQQAGYHVSDLEWSEQDQEARVSGVFRKGPRSEIAFDLTESELQQTLDMQQQSGMQVVDFEYQPGGDTPRFSIVVVESDEKHDLKRDLTVDELEAILTHPRMTVMDIDHDLHGDRSQTSVIVKTHPEGAEPATIARQGLNLVDFEVVDKRMLGRGYFHFKVQANNLPDGDIRFSGIWDRASKATFRKSVQRKMLDPISLVETDRGLRRAGFELIDLGVAHYEKELVYSAVWVQKIQDPGRVQDEDDAK